jgi:hypothetical protein
MLVEYISERGLNYVKWMVGSTTGTGYKLPWRDDPPGLEDVSVSFNIQTAGSAGGSFVASTWDGGWNNDLYKPSSNPTVSNVLNNSGSNNSDKMVDRFWGLIDEGSYTTKPQLTSLRFYYPENEWNVASNNINEADLQAQRWNNSTAPNGWQGLLFGSVNTTSNYVEIASLGPADLFRWWALVDKTSPLPVTWLSISAKCIPLSNGEGQGVLLKWSTASEQNSDYFTVERSFDGINFSSLATLPAAGNSSAIQYYEFVDAELPTATASLFYRIKQTDWDGTFSYSSIVTADDCSEDDIFVYGQNGSVYVNISATEDKQYILELYDVLGQNLTREKRTVTKGNNLVKLMNNNLPGGIYFVMLGDGTVLQTKKVFVKASF